MALITRLSRLFRADMHAVLDRIEEPQQLLQQAIREMEEALLHEEQQLKLLQHEQGQLQRRLQGLEQSLEKSEEELDLCFESNKEELARSSAISWRSRAMPWRSASCSYSHASRRIATSYRGCARRPSCWRLSSRSQCLVISAVVVVRG